MAVAVKTYYATVGSFDSGRDAESIAEYMVWYEDLLKPGLVNAVRNLGEKVAALIAGGE